MPLTGRWTELDDFLDAVGRGRDELLSARELQLVGIPVDLKRDAPGSFPVGAVFPARGCKRHGLEFWWTTLKGKSYCTECRRAENQRYKQRQREAAA